MGLRHYVNLVRHASGERNIGNKRFVFCDDPVPLVISGPGVGEDAVMTYGETAASHGSLGLVQGVEIMPRLMDLARG